jgi:hypothetical protein
MNDTELNRLLDTWEAPGPPESLREGLQARFRRAGRRRFGRPARWALVAAAASFLLAMGMQQSGANPEDFRLVRFVNEFFESFREGIEVWRATTIVAQIRQSDPKVYVDGELAAPLKYGPAARMDVQVPGEGVFSIISYPMPIHRADGELTGWVEAGLIHRNVIEFQAGSKRVRIECNKPIAGSDHSVFALHRQ